MSAYYSLKMSVKRILGLAGRHSVHSLYFLIKLFPNIMLKLYLKQKFLKIDRQVFNVFKRLHWNFGFGILYTNYVSTYAFLDFFKMLNYIEPIQSPLYYNNKYCKFEGSWWSLGSWSIKCKPFMWFYIKLPPQID